MNDMLGRIHRTILLLAITFLTGVTGYMLLGGPDWKLLDAVYMTTISLTTVGYGETHDLAGNPAARLFTIFLLITGYSVVIYATSTITAFLVEGELQDFLRRRKMSQVINKLKEHYIVCGGGETGVVIIGELLQTGRTCVVIENDRERAQKLIEHFGDGLLVVVGDATEDETLLAAGVDRARGMMVVLESDKDSLFVTLTARQLNRDLRIVAKGVERGIEAKLTKAGADSVVSPNFIGGMRICSQVIRPAVVGFLDSMLRDQNQNTRFEELEIRAGSKLDGVTIRNASLLEKVGLLVIALRRSCTEEWVYNPPADTPLAPGTTIVVLGPVANVGRLRELAS